MPAEHAEIQLVPMPVDDQWLHVYYRGTDTDYALHIKELGDLKNIITRYRMRSAMREALEGGSVS